MSGVWFFFVIQIQISCSAVRGVFFFYIWDVWSEYRHDQPSSIGIKGIVSCTCFTKFNVFGVLELRDKNIGPISLLFTLIRNCFYCNFFRSFLIKSLDKTDQSFRKYFFLCYCIFFLCWNRNVPFRKWYQFCLIFWQISFSLPFEKNRN